MIMLRKNVFLRVMILHETVVAATTIEKIREQASTTCLARGWSLEIGEVISAMKFRINMTQI